jgi:hypothetical protein
MGLGSLFLVIPTPCRDISHNRLSVVGYRDVLNCDLRLSPPVRYFSICVVKVPANLFKARSGELRSSQHQCVGCLCLNAINAVVKSDRIFGCARMLFLAVVRAFAALDLSNADILVLCGHGLTPQCHREIIEDVAPCRQHDPLNLEAAR